MLIRALALQATFACLLHAQAPSVVDYTPVTPPDATWPVLVNDPASAASR